MEHIENYRGHKLVAWTEELAPGRWQWQYTIDDEHLTKSEAGSATTERDQVIEAVSRARLEVEKWPSE
jgi:hypothetical protein